MSIIPPSFRIKKAAFRISTSFLATVSALALSSFPLAAWADGDASRLWNSAAKNGQWRAFGQGVLDSRVLSGEGLSLDVDWHSSTFGAGVAYEGGREDATPLPSLDSYRKIRFEARAIGDEARTVTMEFVVRPASDSERERAYRAAEVSTRTLASEWTIVEFEIPGDFPRIEGAYGDINAIRILFPKAESSGRGRVEFRNVELVK